MILNKLLHLDEIFLKRNNKITYENGVSQFHYLKRLKKKSFLTISGPQPKTFVVNHERLTLVVLLLVSIM